jgi:pantoate--beta-alanine ligase
VLHQSLERARELTEAGETNAAVIVEGMKKAFDTEPRAALEYAVIVEPQGLEPVERIEAGSVALVAARVGPARLIDNLILAPAGTTGEERLRLAFGEETRGTAIKLAYDESLPG